MVSYTTNKGYPVPTVAAELNVWGTYLNQGTAILDNNMGTSSTISVAGSVNVTATSLQGQSVIHRLTGALTGNISYLLPAVGSFYVISNASSGAYTITVKTTAGGSTGVTVPQGSAMAVYSDGTNILPMLGTSSGGQIFPAGVTIQTGGVTVTAGGVTIGAGGIAVTGNSSVTGTLGVSSTLTVTAGGITVSAGGATVTGNSAITGALTVSTNATTGTQVPNYSQFAQSNANPGYVSLPGGYRRAFGMTTVTLVSNQATINYGTTFNAVRKVTAANGSMVTSQAFCGVLGNNTTQFIVYVPDQASGTYVVSWDAEGWV